MARIKIRRKKKGEPEWLIQRRLKKQEKYDKKQQCTKQRKPTSPILGDLWPGGI